DWPETRPRHPRLFVTQAEHERFRKSFGANAKALEALRRRRPALRKMDGYVAKFLATGDVALGRKVAWLAMILLQGTADLYARGNAFPTQGCDPPGHCNAVAFAVNGCDLALARGLLSAAQRARMRAQLAYLGYTLADPGVHSPERGFRAKPNMTTSIRCAAGMVACVIPDHPVAKAWAALATAEMKRELETWRGPGRGWMEAPHYMTVSVDNIIPLALALRGTGFSDVDWVHHPKLKKTVEWLAKISTPPNPRSGGRRHLPAMGNPHTGGCTSLPGWLARMWRERDPVWAAGMQWMWAQHGWPGWPGIGGAYPGSRGYRALMFDASIPAAPPKWASECFAEAGAVFRAHFPSDRETYLHYIQGPMHQHYDYDEGSFILWGKGRPLCEDFGYHGRAPAADPSRVGDGAPEPLGAEGRIETFVAGEACDYLAGRRAQWRRRILFVKDTDPLGPNYFLVRDTVGGGRAAHWRVWIATDEAPPQRGNPVRAVGRFDVDLAVFVTAPDAAKLTGEQLTREGGATGFRCRQMTQRCLHLLMPKTASPGRSISAAVLYPVMRGKPTPKFTSLAGGRAVRIDGAFGTDYAMLSDERFTFREGGIRFDSTAGVVQVRGGRVRLSLPRPGKLARGGASVENVGKPGACVSRWFGRD
ncbi:MAG TPA: hypothetical protein VM031_03640, partial [Phycisphaerae bacterium]|nr:hypothetical protein [Phycisphaerae bacterium]